MKRSKLFTMAVAFGLLAMMTVAGTAMAAGPGGHRGSGPMGGFHQMLTDQQQADMQAIFADHYKKVQPLRDQMRSKHAELEAIYYSGSANNSKVQSLFREIADIKAKMFAERMDLKAKLDAKGLPSGHMGPGMHGMGGMGGMGRHDGPDPRPHDNGWHRGGHGPDRYQRGPVEAQ